MKVMLVTGSLPPMKCGVGEYVNHLAMSLSEVDCLDVAVLTGVDASVSLDGRGSGLVIFPIIERGFHNIVKAIRQLHSWKPDVIHFQYPTMGYKEWGIMHVLLPIVAWAMRIPILMTWHEPFRVTRFRPVNELMIVIYSMLLKGLIVVRPNYLDLMPSWFARMIKNKCFRVIPNASTIPSRCLTATQIAAIRRKFGVNDSNMVVYFGFSFPNKNVESIFDIANSDRDFIVLITDLNPLSAYHKNILEISGSEAWNGKVNVTGYLPATEVAEILAAADAVILPLQDGSGIWNTSVHAVISQGTFLVTTSVSAKGYSEVDNVYYAKPGDIADMKKALTRYMGRKNINMKNNSLDGWNAIANKHVEVYQMITNC